MKNSEAATFWQHLDVLRWVLLRSLVVAVIFAVAAFCMKDWLFAVVLAPCTSDFITFQWLCIEPFSIHFPHACGHLCWFALRRPLYHLRTLPFRITRPLPKRTSCWFMDRHLRLSDVHVGYATQLSAYLSAHRPISGYLPSKC